MALKDWTRKNNNSWFNKKTLEFLFFVGVNKGYEIKLSNAEKTELLETRNTREEALEFINKYLEDN